MNNEVSIQDQADSTADAIAAVALILIFVAACVFWVSGQ